MKDFIYLLPLNLPNADGGNCTPIFISGLKEYQIVDHSPIMKIMIYLRVT